ncbi:helix-turn-helix transcriptional regulator [Novosphingobium resinovorum]|jgi:DNA-binding CsgD family transcriptional regulator|uniref:Response regulator n=1 Tax=Novosphingobium resinovorum TaxID=158500 RepID=A0A1D8A277_9SPHN|nr:MULTISPECIES: helix-turn-helix transcriptional regulator [Sphingomonadaceae]AOR76176.1 response regulator [Novosphingobium resinovorum]EJU12320.1 regulatory protein LuxR [Sphingomonas sp. LH128]MBF7011579.1 helix-turn-helix transcriptional regulator [Novosphingobium sp. HR1a]WJM29551.1 helix-turn-helix transcriptional regulator [Novosphingobium resinovorum]
MALTSNDETDLLLPLIAGIGDKAQFAEFLERLRRRSDAEYVSIVMKQGDGPHAQITDFHAGRDLRSEARELDPFEMHALERLHYDQLRPGRVYSVGEFVDHDPVFRADRLAKMARLGIADERVVRLPRVAETDAWLILARAKPCEAADSALLSSLAPYVEAALRSYVALEHHRIRASVSAQGMARSATAWMVFDREARLLAIDPRLDAWMRGNLGYTPRVGERLRDLGVHAERELGGAAVLFASSTPPPPRAVMLHEDPRLEALLTATSDMPRPSMLALCRLPNARTPASVERLTRLFDLPPREAQLAIALNEGQSIAEAAENMGLTLETARNYSKRLYAKLGVRGQAELVRLVSDSVAVMG